MTVTHIETGYLESEEYMSGVYLTGKIEGVMGFQATIVNTDFEKPLGMQALVQSVDFEEPVGMQAAIQNIDFQTPLGMQAKITNTDFETPLGMQAAIQNVDFEKPLGMQVDTFIGVQSDNGMQAQIVIEQETPLGMQAEITNTDFQTPLGMQAEAILNNNPKEMGFEAKVDTLSHITHGKYLNEPYMSESYLTEKMCAFMGMQALVQNVDFEEPVAMQAEIVITDHLDEIGMQAEIVITDFEDPLGMQALIIQAFELGMQATINIYNAKKIRILCNFPSRGTLPSNWTASSTATGDFDIENVDTDITEQIWRSVSSVVTGITLIDDVGVGQQVFLDTFAMLNHNLTTSAVVRLDGSNNAGFVPVGFSEVLQVTEDNLYYIAPTLPTAGFRYWKVTIDDPTNPDLFISVGAILFGASDIFPLTCGMTDQIRFERRDFADVIATEGFTNVSNSRALKKVLGLEFRSQESKSFGFKILKNLFETFRTTHKCLWIPTPSATDQEITGKFAVFGKLTRLPSELHNNKGEPDNDFVDLSVEVDESL